MTPLTAAALPDLHHLIYLRNRLWARRPIGRAAVMVGAGFSLNAESKVAGSRSFPLWRELTAAMLDQLRPLLTGEAREKALDLAASGSGSLTLAREYEATFGRSALNDLIVSAVPDANHSPGALHQALLALPWADVFTTNYDTLLERTPPGEQGRYYDLVVQASDLPNSTQPRIIKLHGSLPATKPFIITEEDFRRYPRDFAPLVNTVQQSMMENDFVLLGFSGDDPNFLSWLGWVRDELTSVRPRVYLCGVLDITDAQRLILRERGVTAIDLGPLFPKDADYPDTRSQRNQQALAWLLYSLHNGQALEPPVEWPHFPKPLDAYRLPLPVEPLAALAAPRPEIITHFNQVPRLGPRPENPEYSKEALAEIKELLAGWQQLRQEYPGWLMLPYKNRRSLWQRTKHLRWPLVEWLASLAPAERLAPLAELVWRLEKCGQFLFDKEYDMCRQVLQEVPLPTSPRKREQWAILAFATLQTLRFRYDHQEFERLLAQLEPLADSQSRYGAWRCWQAALERLGHLDQPGARRWLQRWPAVGNDPVWDLRRAGLWAELNEIETAEVHVLAALETALLQQPRISIRIDMLAVEESARTLLRVIRAEQWWRRDDRPSPFSRDLTRTELARHKLYAEYRCDAFADVGIAEAELKDTEPVLERSVYESVNPYTGLRVRNRVGRAGLNLEAYQPAFDVLVSQEQRGLPFRLAHTRYERLAAASRWLVSIALPYALGMILRTGDDQLLQTLDRAALAELEAADLQPLLTKALDVTEQFFPPAGARQRPVVQSRGQVNYAALALRLLGRTAFRLPADLRERAVQLALGVWENWPERLSVNRIVEDSQFSDFTTGLTAVLTPPEVLRNLPLLLTAAPEPERADSAFESIPRYLLPAVRPAEAVFTSAVAQCLEWLTLPLGQGERRVGLRRLLYLQELGWLTPDEQAVFGKRVWTATLGEDGLPLIEENLASWTVLLLPAPAGIEVVARLKRHLLAQVDALVDATRAAGGADRRPVGFEHVLSELLNATRPATGRLLPADFPTRPGVEWTPTEALHLLSQLEAHLQARLEALTVAMGLERQGIASPEDAYEECRYLGRVLGDVVLPYLPQGDTEAAERLQVCARQLLGVDLPARPLLPALLPLLPEPAGLLTFASTSIRLALMHPTDAGAVQDGAETLCRWAYGAYCQLLPDLPGGALYEYIVRLGLPGLPNPLAVVTWATDLLTAAPRILWPDYADQLADALGNLLQETTLPTWRERILARQVTEQERLFQRPRLREQAARLAGQLAWLQRVAPVASAEAVLQEWAAAASDDIFPEVRRGWQEGNEDGQLQANWTTPPTEAAAPETEPPG